MRLPAQKQPQTYLLHVVSTGGVTDDVTLLTEHRLGGLTVEGEAALRHTDHVLPVHSAFIKHKFQLSSPETVCVSLHHTLLHLKE